MIPSLETFKSACPEIDELFIKEHLSRLGERYFKHFSEHQIYDHIRKLAQITPEHPVELLLELSDSNKVECTVLGFDYPGVFSLIAGVLAGMGFSINTGEMFTYRRSVSMPVSHDRRRYIYRPRSRRLDPLKRRRIIDHFSGTVADLPSFDDWAEELEKILKELLILREKKDDQSINTARNRVNEMVVNRLAHMQTGPLPNMSPVSITVDNSQQDTTRLEIVSEDTPAFIYSLTHAFSLHGIIIEHVRINTRQGQIEDVLDIVDANEKKIDDPALMDRIKLSVLLTKQFTYFLGKAPDPYAALCRFKQFSEDILNMPGKEEWVKALSDPHTLKNLALLLGTSDFLWEDFIRLQYETLLPMFKPMVKGRRFSQPKETLTRRLGQALKGAKTFEEERRRLNAFKDQEIFLIDLDHILNPDISFGKLALRLTRLAELVVNKAATLAYRHIEQRFGRPETAAGLKADFAIMGQGKLGGAALGYASDIEFLLVYGDKGMTNGKESIPNSEFFNRLVQSISQLIESKQEGIFQVDLRLRPYGKDGPLACSLEAFCSYYGKGGDAHSYERLALVRLRAIGGDKRLGSRIERIRDEIVYVSQDIDFGEIRKIREKQFQVKTQKGRKNAKFSLGALVDLEYNVQILQVLPGKELRNLRTPKIHDALREMAQAGILPPQEFNSLSAAYDFFRLLINAMRMLRGSAKDLFLPSEDSQELSHLARRMGYGRGPLTSAKQLLLDYEMHTAAVRIFAKRYFGRTALPDPVAGTVVDLILAENVPSHLYEQILSDAGFQNPARAYTNLLGLAGSGSRRNRFAKLALLAIDILLQTPAPDMALNNWDHFVQALANPVSNFKLLLSQPARLEILLNIFAGSQFLADTLIHYPHLFGWVINPKNLHHPRKKQDFEQELVKDSPDPGDQAQWVNHLRRFRHREILRIGTRDMALKKPTEEIMQGLSSLAEAIATKALSGVFARLKNEKKFSGILSANPEDMFCLLAFGKLGGRELNYSSDIDLLGLFALPEEGQASANSDMMIFKNFFTAVIERLSLDLSRHTEAGYAYRVDLRLRPYGKAGELVPSLSSLVGYYHQGASLWEIQAALKLRPIAGNISLGNKFLEQIRPILLQRRSRKEIIDSVEKMRQASIKKQAIRSSSTTDVKSGIGGIRDVEFLVQGLQLIHATDAPELLQSNTLTALQILEKLTLLPEKISFQLKHDYLFLRQVEHCLQILEDRQTHTLPNNPAEMNTLARRVIGIQGSAADFQEALNDCQVRVRNAYTTYLLKG